MTRINIISPSELTDQHLIAEYREITMVPGMLQRTLKSKKGLDKSKIKKVYTLNKGHVYFFYDKGKYLNKRYNELVKEMKNRGFNPDPNRKFPHHIFVEGLYNDWFPSFEEQKIIRKRIKEKIDMKPNWYRYTKK
jgi:deoxyribonuclease (pyrimidine dimer)